MTHLVSEKSLQSRALESVPKQPLILVVPVRSGYYCVMPPSRDCKRPIKAQVRFACSLYVALLMTNGFISKGWGIAWISLSIKLEISLKHITFQFSPARLHQLRMKPSAQLQLWVEK